MSGMDGPKILLVEDLPLHRRIIPLRLGPWGMDIHVVNDAESAEVYLRDHRPALILMDAMLPGKDGFALCRELKSDPRTRDIAIVMLTELEGDAFALSSQALADDYFPKWAQDIVLRTRVHLHLQLQELRAKVSLPSLPASGNILLATDSRSLRTQLPLEAHLDGNFLHVVERLEDIPGACHGEDALLVVDASLGVDKVSELVVQLRGQAETEGIAFLLLCLKTELSVIPGLLSLVDDALWMPMKPTLARQRMHLLMELGQRRKALQAAAAPGPEFPY